MNTQQLRNSILQLAIQGKLVPQDPNDEPASVLLERIKEWRNSVVGQGKKCKKEKSCDWETPFDIPSSWVWAKWGEVSSSIQYGYNAPAKEHGRIKMVRISDIHDNKIFWDGVPYCDIDEDEIDNYKLQVNDILFARTGGTVGKSYLVSDITVDAIFAGYLIRTHYNSTLIEPLYLKFFMESGLYWSQLRDGTIATAQPNCNGQKLAAMYFPLPPLSEQRRIVAKLEELLPLVEQYGKAQDNLDALNNDLPRRLRQSILQEAIQGKLVPQDPSDEPASVAIDKSLYTGKISTLEDEEYPFEIPSNWCFCRLQDVAATIGGYAFSSQELKDKGVRVIRISDVTPNGFSSKNIVRYNGELTLEQYQIKNKDILIAMTGGTVGKSYLVTNLTEKLLLNQRVAIVRAREHILPQYLSLLIQSPLTQDIINDHKNSTNDNISMVDIRSFSIPLPPLAEQRRIVAKIEQLFAAIDNLK